MDDVLFHFSEDPAIGRFAPHVPATNPGEPPAVWVIDAEHAPLYWFPRDCPRVAVWPWPDDDPAAFESAWATTARRVHVLEDSWLDRMRSTALYRYSFDPQPFARWPAASGYWVSHVAVDPIAVEQMGDLAELHRTNHIDLRAVENLWPTIDMAESTEWDFSIVRKANAHPRR